MIYLPSRLPANRCPGISAVEILVTIAVLGLLATVTSLAVSGVNENAHHRRPTSSVQTLISACEMDTANGGDLSGTTDPNCILYKFDTRPSKEDHERHFDADYVRITNLQQNIGLEINGVAYQMRLEFGATDSFGFSTNSEFHVYEGATGQGEVLATFISRN